MGSEHSFAGRPRTATLAALALAVLGLHVLLLQSAAQWSVPASERAQPMSLETRMLEASRPAAATAPNAAPVAPATPAQNAAALPSSTPAQSAGLTAVTARPPVEDSLTEETASPPTPPASAPVAAAAVATPPAEPASAPSLPGPSPEAAATLPAPLPAPLPAALPTALPAVASPATPAPLAPPTASTSAESAEPGATSAKPPAGPARIAANKPPASVRLKYRVEANRFPFSLSSELSWQQDGQNYQARLEFSALGQSRVQTSRGLITPGGLAPLRFSDKYRTEVAAHFNREQGKVTFSANTPDIALLPGAQDRLSVLIQLAALLAGERAAYTVGNSIAIQTIGPRDADTWLFSVEAEELLQLPGGEQATLKLLRKPRKEFDQRVELWLAPALGYLPVRVRITEANGDALDQKWLASETLR